MTPYTTYGGMIQVEGEAGLDGGRARLSVNQRELPERAAVTDAADRTAVDDYVNRATVEDVEVIAFVALLDDDRALPGLDLEHGLQCMGVYMCMGVTGPIYESSMGVYV